MGNKKKLSKITYTPLVMSDLSDIVNTLKDWGLGREERRILLEDPYFDADVFQRQKKFYEDSEKAVYNSLKITNLNGKLVIIPTKDVFLNLKDYIQFTKAVPEDLMFGSNGKILDFGSYTSTSFKFSPAKIGLAALAFGVGVTGYSRIIGNAVGDTTDDDTTLGFYWNAASGPIDHYNVYLSTNGANFEFVGATPTSTAPAITSPYTVPITAEDGKKYRLMVEAVDAVGNGSPMSEQSDIVFCKLRSPGDAKGKKPGDINGDDVVNHNDYLILVPAYGTPRGHRNFDYRADMSYDDAVNLVDFLIFTLNLGNDYRTSSNSSVQQGITTSEQIINMGVVQSNGTLVGVNIGGEWVVLFSATEQPITQASYSVQGSGQLNHLIADLVPSTEYYRYRNGQLITPMMSATSAGTLYFTSELGEFWVSQSALFPTQPGQPIHIDELTYSAPLVVKSSDDFGICKVILNYPERFEVGKTFSIDVYIDAEKIKAIDIRLPYNPKYLKIEGDVQQGDFFSTQDSLFFNRDINQEIMIVGALPGPNISKSGNGIFATVRFTPLLEGITYIKPIIQTGNLYGLVNEQKMDISLNIGSLEYLLLQNYPNPFNPETWIPYAIAEECNPAIVIYNLLGQKVRQLELGHKNPGDYTTKDKTAYWDGCNEWGEKVASGVYIYRIQANDFTQTRKMVLIR